MNDTLALLKEHRLQEALDALRPAFADDSRWELAKEYSDICTTYRYLLDYFRQGADDPQRETVFTQLAGRLLVLNDRIELSKRPSNGASFGTPTLWTQSHVCEARERWQSATHTGDRCLMISDMTLSLLVVFDPLKIPVLCEAATLDSEEVAVRAITAIDLVLRYHAERLPFYPNVTTRLRQLFTDSLCADMLADVELQLAHSLDTERIERQMREDIIPTLLHSPLSPIQKHPDKPSTPPEKGKQSPFSDDVSTNPDWEEWMQKSGIEEKMRELTEMQMNGADVYIATFAQMKSYPFFSHIENWFRLFDPTNEAISNLFPTDEKGVFTLQRLVMLSDTFCNSDKYSFCLALNQLPYDQRSLLRSQLREQKEMLDEDTASTLSEVLNKRKGKPTTKVLTRQYLQDLYRFFLLCYQRHTFPNPFKRDFIHQTQAHVTDIAVLPASCLCAMAELDIQRKDYEGADTLFTLFMLHHPSHMDATLWQKAGYCRQLAKRYDAAIEALTMADVLMPGHPWTMLHLAQCYRKNGNDIKALEYYESVAKQRPDDLSVLWQKARLLMRLHLEEEALPLLQRIAYEEPNAQRVMILLTEAYLRTGRVEQATKQADRMTSISSIDITANDLFMAACAYWLGGRREEAIALFQQMETFDKNKALTAGIPERDIPFLHDLIVSLS